MAQADMCSNSSVAVERWLEPTSIVGKLDYYVAFVFWMEVRSNDDVRGRSKPLALKDAGIDVSNI